MNAVGAGGIVLLFAFYGLILLFGLAAMAFWIWMLVDCATKEPSTGNDKTVWIVVICLTHWIGALIYFVARRPERIRQAALAARGGGAPAIPPVPRPGA